MRARTKWPPFARQLGNTSDTIWLFCGPAAWQWAANDRRSKLLLPPGHDPVSYHWPVAGRDVVILDTGSTDASLRRTAWVLLSAGATRVGCIPLAADCYIIFTRTVRHAA